jgi:hypothetical protein
MPPILYLASINQTAIWNGINASPLFQDMHLSPVKKDEWFKDIIKHIHETNPPPKSYSELQILNRETISFMVNKLKQLHSTPKVINSNLDSERNIDIQDWSNKTSTDNTKDTTLTQQFDTRRTEYIDIMRGNVPANIDFQLSELDEPIKDIDELVKRQIEERRLEVKRFTTETPEILQHKVSALVLGPVTELAIVDENYTSSTHQIHEYKERRVSWKEDNISNVNITDISNNDILNTVERMMQYIELLQTRVDILEKTVRDITFDSILVQSSINTEENKSVIPSTQSFINL